ncbi:KTSC domain-containing protein [Natrinema sp. 1APR25-10V2]|uniref:KTSC domain-containing protein n=1 Tax=Natrinema sp. 1APR25-10V2 TaxID=2951081 RepID=UPI0031F2DFBD
MRCLNAESVFSPSSVRSTSVRRPIFFVEFHGGRVYQYYNVPKRIYQGLMAASSHGKYHHRRIKDSYRYSRIR